MTTVATNTLLYIVTPLLAIALLVTIALGTSPAEPGDTADNGNCLPLEALSSDISPCPEATTSTPRTSTPVAQTSP